MSETAAPSEGGPGDDAGANAALMNFSGVTWKMGVRQRSQSRKSTISFE
jgi:hypothetical protein